MSIRLRTGYSFRNAVGSLAEAMARVQEIGLNVAPITDTSSAFGWVRWSKLAEKAGLRPVYGVEIAVTPSIHAKKPVTDGWTFIARDSLEPLNRLIGKASEQFRYQPLLSIEQACAETGVFAIAGHRSPIEQIPALGHLYVSLAPSATRGYLRRALAAGHKLVAASDNRFLSQDGQPLYEIICGRNASTQTYPQYLLSDEEWWTYLEERAGLDPVELLHALANRDAIFDASTARLHKAEMIHPARPATLEKMCRDGAKKLGVNLRNKVYADRMKYELMMIRNKNFEDYFYLVADICQWARERMIVGPARGSSCGSLVCYLLGITSVDPIPFGLIFERFIDINRNDYPDIDIDFSEQHREMVFEYVAQKYGREHVARLGTVAMYQPRSALKEAAGAMGIPVWELNQVMDAIIERSSGDSRAMQATEDTLRETEAGRTFLNKYPEMEIAMRMEGHPRHSSQHAAGIVLTQQPIETVIPIDHRVGATHCDKKDAEDLDLLKVDALGLTQLSIFEDALELAGLPRDHLFTIPLDDEPALQVLRDSRYAGIFQFNGLALQYVTEEIQVNSFNDIVSITALARPGPINTGGTRRWIDAKNDPAKESYPHPIFEKYLKETLGVITYQEQIMVIGREIGDLTWEDVTAMRKAMSKSLGVEFFNKYGDPWKEGAIKKGIKKELADSIWNDLCAFGSYGFNKSHAVAYGLISYWCCWLKAHHPLEFAAATLTHTDSPSTQIKLLRELAAEGTEYVPAHLEASGDRWSVGTVEGRKALVGPLSNVLGVGPKMQSAILSARARGEPIPERAQKLLANPKTKIDSLYPIKTRFSEILPDPTKKNIFSAPREIQLIKENGAVQEVMVFCTIESIKTIDENDEIRLAKRGGRRLGAPTTSLNLRLADDTGVVFAKVSRFDFDRLGKPIAERGRAGKCLYAIKGTIPKDFRMISVKAVRYIGDMEKDDEA